MWKSNNQGVNKETFIQTSRKGGDGQPGRRGLLERWQLEDWVGKMVTGRLGEAAGGGPGSPTFAWDVDKPGGTTGEQDRPHNQGFQRGKRKPQNLWL